MSDSKICSKCGVLNPQSSNFCNNCGSAFIKDPTVASESLNASIQSVNQNAQQPQHEDIELLIGLDGTYEYYKEKFDKMKMNNTILSWNWSAFFFGSIWFFLRKMYFYGAILFMISNFTPFILSEILPYQMMGIHFFFLTNIPCGIFANYFYLKHLNKHLEIISTMSDYEKGSYVETYGGSSIGKAILYYAGFLVLMIIFGFQVASIL